jgi:methylthioribose-1-phosphate isomerase
MNAAQQIARGLGQTRGGGKHGARRPETVTSPFSTIATTLAMAGELDLSRFDTVRALRWTGAALELLDQRVLPQQQVWHRYTDADGVAQAIADLVVRGAPAIGIAAGYGVVLAARASADRGAWLAAIERLRQSRPTAVNLFWALARMRACIEQGADVGALERQARAIEAEDYAANRCMAEAGARYLAPGSGVLTHCNTGSLATAGLGTALGVIRAGYAQGRIAAVYAGETRPWLQGARLTTWELLQDGIPAKLIADSAGAYLMSTGAVQWLIVGADRIAANADTANKIGTLQLAIAARHFGVRTMVVAPSTTVDLATACGADIHVELRNPEELLSYAGTRVAAPGVAAWNPVFDVTPAALIEAIVTERGVVERPSVEGMRACFADDPKTTP